MEITSIVTATGGAVLATAKASQSTIGWGATNSFAFTASTSKTTLTFKDTCESITDTDLTLDNVVVEAERPRVTISVSYVDVCWDSVSNGLYQVQASQFGGDLWVNIGSPVLATGTKSCFTDAVKGEPAKFYRIVELP